MEPVWVMHRFLSEMCGIGQNCSAHGSCTNNTVSHVPSRVCLCDDGWTGDYCSLPGTQCTSLRSSDANSSIPDDDCPYECLTQGECVDGVCVCDKGWTGDFCQDSKCTDRLSILTFFFEKIVFRTSVVCPNDCSAHGACIQFGSFGGRCNCSWPWYSENCSLGEWIVCAEAWVC